MKIIEYISYVMIPLLLIIILIVGERKKVHVYDLFIEGAAEGFSTIAKIFPTVLAVIIAINIFKISGAMDLFVKLVRPIISLFNVPGEVVPIGIMRSVSGGGALAVLSDVFKEYGPDSLVGRISSTIMGSSDTTLYVLAIYTSTIGIKKTKNALFIGLFCDLVAFLVAVWIWQAMV